MAATPNGYGERIAGFRPVAETVEDTEALRYAQNSFLDELPGIAFALITLAYLVFTLYALI